MNDYEVFNSLHKLTSGECAALCREAGKCMADASAQALAVFYRIAPPELNRRQQECWFTAITLACLWNVEEAQAGDEFAVMLKKYARKQETGGTDKKIRTLLDTRWEEDGYLAAKLSRLARMLRSDNRSIMPDVDRLLDDLLHWNSDSRYVQLRWAQRFYQPDISETQSEEE